MSDKVEDKVEDVPIEDTIEANSAEAVSEDVNKAPNDQLVKEDEKKADETSESKNEAVNEKKQGEEEEEARPPLPVRKSTSPNLETENPMLKQLKDAFPGMEERYVKAVLIASQGQLDPAFNALLFLSDPAFEKEAALPTGPAGSTQSKHTAGARRQLTQLEQDEMLARQLDEKFNKHGGRQSAERAARKKRIEQRERDYERKYGSGAPHGRRDSDGYEYGEDANDEEEDVFSNFVEKDLPQIRDNLNRNIQETGKKISTWFNGIKKNLVDEDSDYDRSRAPRRANSRFNSFGDRYSGERLDGATKLQNAGISLQNDELDFDSDEDVPPQLPSRAERDKVVAETTYIDTPEPSKNKHNRSPLRTIPPHSTSPSKDKPKPKPNTDKPQPATPVQDEAGPITLEDKDIVVDSDLEI